MAVPSSVPSSFHEHQQELCKLSEYIQEKQLLVNGVLEALGCSEEDLHDKVLRPFLLTHTYAFINHGPGLHPFTALYVKVFYLSRPFHT